MSITLRYADSRNQAVEIMNDAFMKVFENIKSYDQKRPFKPWFRRIVINTAINHYHKNAKRKVHENFALHENNIGQNETITATLSYEEIIEMVQHLSPAYRTVFNLHVIEGFSHREIADMLEISVGTSKSNLFKAKKNLQVIIKNNLSVNLK